MQKKLHKLITNECGQAIINELVSDKCQHCIISNVQPPKSYNRIVCPLDNSFKRIRLNESCKGNLFACGENYTKTCNFHADFEIIIPAIKTLIETYNSVKDQCISEITQRVDRVVHNLRSLNAHSLGEIYALIPQEELIKTKNHREALDFIKSRILSKNRDIPEVLFRITKNTIATKAEFTIYEKLLKGRMSINKRSHNVRNVILGILYSFFIDFNTIKVRVDVADCFETVNLDYESFQVAIYHIIENACKYIEPNSTAYIYFERSAKEQYIIFKMSSLYIEPIEEKDIFNEGYSGHLAIKTNKAGQGIGMFRAKTLIELNGGTLGIEPGEVNKIIDGIEYAENKFIITLPLV